MYGVIGHLQPRDMSNANTGHRCPSKPILFVSSNANTFLRITEITLLGLKTT